jgi:hypothetical protein
MSVNKNVSVSDVAELEAIYKDITEKDSLEKNVVLPQKPQTKKKLLQPPTSTPPQQPPLTVPVTPQVEATPISTPQAVVAPKSIDQYILETAEAQKQAKIKRAEEEKIEFINNAYKKILAALIDAPILHPTQQNVSEPLPDGKLFRAKQPQENIPKQKHSYSFSLKTTLAILVLCVISGASLLYLILHFV